MKDEVKEILKKLDIGSTISANDMIVKQYKEIERLNKELEEYKKDFNEANDLALKLITNNQEYVCKSIKDTIDILIKKLQQKENIIKEVREYIESYDLEYLHEATEHNLADILEVLLEILDKENK